MSAFLDASVLVSLISREDDWADWAQRIDEEADALTSSLAIWETVRALQRITRTPYAEVERQLRETLSELGVRIVSIADQEASAAILAQARYGKNEHPAKLNMGDCFAYACAKTNNAKLLYKGDDFAKTDLA